MPSKIPDLIVWDTCCLLGLFNNEQNKIPGLKSELTECHAGAAYLGIPTAAMGEVVYLSDKTSAAEVLESFLDQRFVQQLNNNREIGLLTSKLQFRFDLREQSALLVEGQAFGLPRTQTRLKAKDAEILATAIVYKAIRLTTYDPLLRFIGHKFGSEFGLTIDYPQTSFLPFTDNRSGDEILDAPSKVD